MSTQGNVAELVNNETIYHCHVNEKNMLYRTNRSGGAVASGDVVVLDSDNAAAFDLAAGAGDLNVLGVIPQKDDVDGNASDQTIANNAAGMVQFVGDIAKVNVKGPTAIGDYLIASATTKKADSVGATYLKGVFARATSAWAGPGAGTVSAFLFPVEHGENDHANLANIGTNTHSAIDTHLAATAAVHGLPASVNLVGDRTSGGAFFQHGQATPSGGSVVVTFPVAFPNACLGVFCAQRAPAAQAWIVTSVSKTQFTLEGASCAHYWLAIGN